LQKESIPFLLLIMSLEFSLVTQVVEVLSSARVEIMLFTCAFLMHHFLFATGFWKDTTSRRTKAKLSGAKNDRSLPRSVSDESPTSPEEDPEQALRNSEAAYERGDHRAVLRFWTALRKSDKASPVHLSRVVEAMQRFKKDSASIVSEVRGYIKRNAEFCDIAFVNRVLETLAKSLDVQVITGIIDAMPSLNLHADTYTYEVLIGMYFSTRAFGDVRRLSTEMSEKGLVSTQRTNLTLLKTALQNSELDNALKYLREISSSSGSLDTASLAPTHIMAQLVELACREHRVELVVDELESGRVPLTTEVLNAVLGETAKSKNAVLTRRIEELAAKQGTEKNGRTYQLLTKSGGQDRTKMQQVLSEMATNGSACSQEMAQSVLNYCTQHADTQLADQLYAQVASMNGMYLAAIISGLLRFYADADMPEKACEIFDQQIRKGSGDAKARCVLDPRTERSLIGAALKLGREETVLELLNNSHQDTAKHIGLVRSCTASGNLNGAMVLFRALQKSGAELTNSLWNTVLDSCVECHNLERAEQLMQRMVEEKVVDAVSYNTLIKAHLQHENYDRSRSIMDDMRKAGFEPNNVTYNELISSLARSEKEQRRSMVWDVVAEMQKVGVRPNRITCSILLRNLKAKSPHSDVVRTMELVESMEEAMDEVLLSSIVEACVRTGKTGLLAHNLEKLHAGGKVRITGAHTFGSLIKAYGHVKDISGAWRCWKEMRSQHVKPTSITIGCMVEAVVSNGDVDGGYELISELLDDESCKSQVNAIIFGSVLKGYGRTKRLERVLAVFDEMTARGIEPALTTFNAVLDACARNGQMERAPGLLQDMQKRGLEANLITYSTLMKGFCQEGDIPAALATFEELQKNGKNQPDEIVYNTILDGCVQAKLVKEGEKIFADMQASRIAPSNYTVTCMIKLMGQARRVDRAIEIATATAQRYRFRLNSHVYSALLHACIMVRDTSRAVSTYEKASQERVLPDAKACQGLVRILMTSGDHVKAVSILRSMLRMSSSTPAAYSEKTGAPFDESFLNDVLGTVRKGEEGATLAKNLLADIQETRPTYREGVGGASPASRQQRSNARAPRTSTGNWRG
jgi:pentatricopeptide repeat protein